MELELFYFNNKNISPLIIIISTIETLEHEIFLENNTNNIFELLIENNLADKNSILIFNLIKLYNHKIINWILPSSVSDNNLINQLHDNNNNINNIIINLIKNNNCENILLLSENELKLRKININLQEHIEYYQN